MAESVTLKRIVDMVVQMDVDDSVYIIIDSQTGGPKRYPAGSLICSIAPIFDTATAYVAGKYCNYNGKLYEFTADHAAGSWTGTDATEVTLADVLSDLKDDLSQKPSSDGTYENMTVGSAQQLLSDEYTEDKEPYLYRASGGSVSVGTREYDEIVGGSVVWNQLIQNGNFADDFTGWDKTVGSSVTVTAGVCKFTTTTSSNRTHAILQEMTIVSGHKYICAAAIKNLMSGAETFALKYFATGGYVNGAAMSIASGETKQVSGVFAATEDGTRLAVGINANLEAMDVFEVSAIMLIDLTQMLGSAVADHIYSLETATAGAGVAFFRKLFPDAYYAYSAGEIKSVGGLVSHDTSGKNIWGGSKILESFKKADIIGLTYDEETVTFGAARMSKKILFEDISFKENTAYTVIVTAKNSNATNATNMMVRYTDDTYQVITEPNPVAETKQTCAFVTNPNKTVKYIGGVNASGNTTLYYNECGLFEGELTVDQFEPYAVDSYPLDSTLTLRGIPEITDGKLAYKGDVYHADGTVERRFGVVDLGTVTWNFHSSASWNCFYASGFGKKNGVTNFVIPIYKKTPLYNTSADKAVYGNVNNANIYIRDSSYETTNAFKEAMSGVMLVYELAEPTTEQAEPYQPLQIVDAAGTEEYLISDSVDVPIPVGHSTKYPTDLKAKIEGLPWNFARLIAPTEAMYTATRAYTTGALFIVNNILYKATTSIVSGGTITPGTNCTATTLAEVISAL